METIIPWWKKTTIYQIYPRSFSDSNNDGIGDLQGIISKLDYIQNLGFETIWISPFFKSPQQDFGYDVSDYLSIAPEYGTLADVKVLISGVHSRGMRIIFDLVLNHTSNQHPWFLESSSSRDNPKRDWYIWEKGKGSKPPNNWVSITGGSGWHYDEVTGEYYYASFLPFQPDLNWRNLEVQQAMLGVCRYWLDEGIDGFRLDIFHSIFKEKHFTDNPFSFHYLPHDEQMGFFQEWSNTLHQPETFALAENLRDLLDRYPHKPMLIGEVFGSHDIVKNYLGANSRGLHLIFLWKLLNVKTKARFLKKVIQQYEKHYPEPFSPVYVFGNHDVKRVISHINDDHRIAKLLAVFQLTSRGVPVVYYGEEIGMVNRDFPTKTALDPIGRKYKDIPNFIFNIIGYSINRDGCRTPMQWEDKPNAGFCSEDITPWLPVHENYRTANVRSQQSDENSLLNTYKKLLFIRRENAVFQEGSLHLLDSPEINKNLLVYKRQYDMASALVILNLSKRKTQYKLSFEYKRIMLSIGGADTENLLQIILPSFSAMILEL